MNYHTFLFLGGIINLNTEKSNLYKTNELLLTEEDQLFYAFKKDVSKTNLSRKIRKNLKRNDVIESEYCYSVSGDIIQYEPFYREQLPNARYTKTLCILDNQRNVIQEIPILKVIQSRSGALNFGIDRRTFTEKLVTQKLGD